jgi:hypothetical protein
MSYCFALLSARGKSNFVRLADSLAQQPASKEAVVGTKNQTENVFCELKK